MSVAELNLLEETQLKALLTNCCGSSTWVNEMASLFPFNDTTQLFDAATSCWHNCNEKDWLEAFTHHPKIGDLGSLQKKFATTAAWAEGEQAAVKQSPVEVLE